MLFLPARNGNGLRTPGSGHCDRGIIVLDPGVLESSACSRVSTMTVEATVR